MGIPDLWAFPDRNARRLWSCMYWVFVMRILFVKRPIVLELSRKFVGAPQSSGMYLFDMAPSNQFSTTSGEIFSAEDPKP